MARRPLLPQLRARGVTAILGPTNTGKTHLAIERMLGHESGMIGLPLRLLAREVYNRVVEKVGAENVALVTGEEKIKPDRARYWISTVEAMPRDLDLAFVAIDEVQLAADLDRGHVFTDRLLHQRGREETLLIGSSVVLPLVQALIPGVHVATRPRLSKLTFAGEKKISRLPHRTAIVAFSAEEVYAIAELIRRQRGGAAVVLGALSPRTRNAQVELYQSGHVDYLVATDAIGMGLNLDVDHVAFAADRKFDGFRYRKLFPAELGQIAGRAGRYLRDGTFGTSGRCSPFEPEMVDALENHRFEPVRVLQWRNADLDFSSVRALQESLAETPREPGLTRAPIGEDVAALDVVAREAEVRDYAHGARSVERLWEACQVPDYRKVSPLSHADLVSELYRFLMRDGAISADWFARQLAQLDRTDGDIDTLSNRIAQVRTWTFVANRPDWLEEPEHWQGITRQVEDRLSDALHERLASRFVDRRTSVLMRRLRENAIMDAEITATGDVTVEGQHVGHLRGFHFVPDPGADGTEAKALRNAAAKALAGEIEARAERFSAAADASLVLSNDGVVRWTGDPVAKLEPGDKLLEPRLRIVADEQLTGPARDKVEARLTAWLKAHVTRLLGPLMALETSAELTGLARGIAFQIGEALGVLERAKVLQDVRSLDQDGRAALRRQGVRFGAFHLYLPALLKPAPRILATQLWALRNGGLDQKGLDEIAHLAGSGRTSMAIDPEIAKGLYRAAGFRVCGGRAVRVDILERLADLIRPAMAYRPGITPGEPPAGAADGEGFVPTVSMTSLVGCSGEDFASILRSLGYVMERRAGPPITVPLAQPAPAAAARTGEPATAQPPAAGAPNGTDPDPMAVAFEAALVEGAPGEEAENEESAPDGAGPASPEVAELAAPDAAGISFEAALADADPEPADDDGADSSSEIPFVVPDEDARSDAALPEVDGAPVISADELAAAETDEGDRLTDDPPPSGGAASEPVDESVVDLGPSLPALPEAQASIAEVAAKAEGAGLPGPGEDTSPPDAGLEASAAPSEPVLIEVWRLHRRHRDGAGAPRHRGQRPRTAAAAPGGERQPDPAADNGRGPRPHGPDRMRGRERRPEERNGEERRPEGAQARGPHRRDGGRPSRHDRGPPGRNERGPPPRDERRVPERRDRAPDPNSPFAKLLALKAQLEGRKGDDG